jgi:hypothetical protein
MHVYIVPLSDPPSTGLLAAASPSPAVQQFNGMNVAIMLFGLVV